MRASFLIYLAFLFSRTDHHSFNKPLGVFSTKVELLRGQVRLLCRSRDIYIRAQLFI